MIEDAEKQNKISELYDLVHQSESMAVALPEVVDRLEALQGLHEQGTSALFNGFMDLISLTYVSLTRAAVEHGSVESVLCSKCLFLGGQYSTMVSILASGPSCPGFDS